MGGGGAKFQITNLYSPVEYVLPGMIDVKLTKYRKPQTDDHQGDLYRFRNIRQFDKSKYIYVQNLYQYFKVSDEGGGGTILVMWNIDLYFCALLYPPKRSFWGRICFRPSLLVGVLSPFVSSRFLEKPPNQTSRHFAYLLPHIRFFYVRPILWRPS